MENQRKYEEVFTETFHVSSGRLKGLKYQDIQSWDSVGHMALIDALETAFGIEMNTEDIIDLSSFEKGKDILANKYSILF